MAHLGLLASAQDSFVSETELSGYYLILKGYCSGFVHVCLCRGTTLGVNRQTPSALLHLWGPCNGIL